MIPDSYQLKIWLLLVLKRVRHVVPMRHIRELFDGVSDNTDQIETVVDATGKSGETDWMNGSLLITPKGIHAIENHSIKELPETVFFRLQKLLGTAPDVTPPADEDKQNAMPTARPIDRCKLAVIKLLRAADAPLRPRDMEAQIGEGISSATFKHCLQVLLKENHIIGHGQTANRVYVLAGREALLDTAPETPARTKAPAKPRKQSGRAKPAPASAVNPTRTFLEDNVSRARGALDEYIERVADPHILNLLRQQLGLANDALANYYGASK